MPAFKEKLNHIRAFAFDVDGVLSKEILVHPSGELMRTMNPKDGYAIQYAMKMGYHLAIITGGVNDLVKERFRRIGVPDVYMASTDKLVDFNDFCQRRSLQPHEVLYMGDDIPDMRPMMAAGIGACPSDGAVDVRLVAHYISDLRGGEGCVRDVIEQVLRARGHWLADQAHHW